MTTEIIMPILLFLLACIVALMGLLWRDVHARLRDVSFALERLHESWNSWRSDLESRVVRLEMKSQRR